MTSSMETVDEIVYSNRPLRQLQEHFPDAVSGLTHYGNAMQRQFTPGAVTEECAICDQPGKVLQFYRWTAMVQPQFSFGKTDALLLLAGRVGFTLEQTVVQFETAHRVCAACAQTTKLRRGLSVLVKAVSFFLLLVGLGLTILFGALCLYMIAKQGWPLPRDMMSCVWAAASGVVSLIVAVPGLKWERALRVPTRFKVIGRNPFWLAGVTTS